MSKAESAGLQSLPMPEPHQFELIQGEETVEETQELEFEESFWLSAASDENRRFVEDIARESGLSPNEILNAALYSYASLYGVFKQGLPLFYKGSDGRLHRIDDGSETPAAS